MPNEFSKTPIKGVTEPGDTVETPDVVTTPSQAGDNLTPNTVGTYKPLKQEKVAEVLGSGRAGDSASSVGGLMGRSASYSGNDASISGSLAATPTVQGNSRGGSRYGKKIDHTVKKINDLGSEQVIVDVTKASPLSDGKRQGSNRSNRNYQTIRTKTKGVVPASELFQRSLDEVYHDELIYGQGQMVKSPTVNYEDVPTQTFKKNDENIYFGQNLDIKGKGDYVPRALNFTLNADGVVTDLSWDVDDITAGENEEQILNASASHAKTAANKAELHRRFIDDVAGDESKEGWSPLARAVDEPTRTVGYLKDLEQDTGNHAYMSARFAQFAHSYQVNRAGKDGNYNDQPVQEAFYGLIDGERDFTNLTNTVQDILRDQAMMKKGSPALIISAFDSITKYKTKGDILNFPNGLKQHLFKGLGFLSNLKANQNLVKYIEKNQTFSTPDGEYDGIKPVYIDDTYLITSPFDWNDQLSFSGKEAYDPDLEQGMNVDPFIYGYNDLRARYYTVAHHPLLKGIYEWLSRVGASLVKAGGAGSYKIPISYSTTKFSLWTFIVMASLADVEKTRLTTMREILYFEEKNGKELFSDLLSLKGYPTTSAIQFTFSDIGEPLKVGTMHDDAKLKWFMPEMFWNFDEETRNLVDYRHVVVPWYFNEENFTANGITSVDFDGYTQVMSWPKVRSGQVLDQLYAVTQRDEREVRLALDRMIYPLQTSFSYGDFRSYKYEIASDGIPAVAYKQSDITYHRLLSTPREIGIRSALPAGYAVPLPDGTMKNLTDNYLFDTSFRAKVYVGNISDLSNKDNVIDNSSVNIDRGSLYNQQFFYRRAYHQSSHEHNPGFALSVKELFAPKADAGDMTFVDGQSVFTPFTNKGIGYNQVGIIDDEHKVISLHTALWTRLQLIPFVISPWDAVSYPRANGEDGQKYDIFDFAYMFGFVGFEGSYFEEDHMIRMDKQLQEGYVYTDDLLVLDTSLLK